MGRKWELHLSVEHHFKASHTVVACVDFLILLMSPNNNKVPNSSKVLNLFSLLMIMLTVMIMLLVFFWWIMKDACLKYIFPLMTMGMKDNKGCLFQPANRMCPLPEGGWCPPARISSIIIIITINIVTLIYYNQGFRGLRPMDPSANWAQIRPGIYRL